MNILSVNDLVKEYSGKISYTAVDGINFQLKQGEFVAIMGPSGSGKSTFLNCVSTLDRPTKGEVLINNKNPNLMNDEQLARFRRQDMGFVFQDFNLIHTLTVEENILLPLILDNCSPSSMNEKLSHISNFLGITSILKKRTFEISGGQAQRVAIARAIIQKPSLLFADEPTGNLDSKSTKDVLNLFSKINQTLRTSILVVTHDAFVSSHCDRVVFIKDGKVNNEIVSDNNQPDFYQRIMGILSSMGGGKNDIQYTRP